MEKTIGMIWILVCLIVSGSTAVVQAKTSSSNLQGIIDPTIRLPKGQTVKQSVLAVGFQIYNFNGTAWALQNVSADLYDFKGRKVGFHYFLKERDANGGMATWETFRPASRVTAIAIASVPQQDAISFVLLKVTSSQGSTSRFGSTSFVQRLFTHMGLPPRARNAVTGDVYNSYYTALYTFASPKNAA